MALDIRDFDQMVDDTCERIVDADVGIDNIGIGSVTRTLIEAITAELDIANFMAEEIYESKNVDTAEGEDLDNVVSILGVTRMSATPCFGTVSFKVTEISDSNIPIEKGQIISTEQSADGTVYEFETIEDAVLVAGQLSVNVSVRSVTEGYVYIPSRCLTIMNTPIIGIESVENSEPIIGGSEAESDESLRTRSKDALTKLGKGTSISIEETLKEIDGVIDAMVLDMNQGVGTSDAVVTCDIMPPTKEMEAKINAAIESVKASGIKIYVIHPDTILVDINVDTTGGSSTEIYNCISEYVLGLDIADSLILNQLIKSILIVIGDPKADVTFISPTMNINATGTQIIRANTITVNGVKYYDHNS